MGKYLSKNKVLKTYLNKKTFLLTMNQLETNIFSKRQAHTILDFIENSPNITNIINNIGFDNYNTIGQSACQARFYFSLEQTKHRHKLLQQAYDSFDLENVCENCLNQYKK